MGRVYVAINLAPSLIRMNIISPTPYTQKINCALRENAKKPIAPYVKTLKSNIALFKNATIQLRPT